MHVLVGNIQFLGDFWGDVDSFSVGTFFFGGGAVEIFDSSPMISQEMVPEKSTFSHAGMDIAMFGHPILGEGSNSTEFTLELKEEIRDVDPHVQLHLLHFIARSNVSRLVLNMADICRKRALGKCSRCTPL